MLKVGIIGLGVGESHIKGYEAHDGCKVVSICDFSDDVLNEISPKYPAIKSTTNPNDILEDPEINVVTIASYDNYHCEQIIKAIDNNKHVFVEKPVCIFEQEAIDILNALSKKPSIKISSNLILRKSERFIELKRLIDKGDLGEIFHLKGAYNYGRIHKIIEGWRGELDFYSIIYGGGVHVLDLFLWMLNERVTEVSAFGNNIATKDSDFSNFDMVDSVLKFESGIIANLSCNFACVHPHFHQYEVYGTKGTFINGLENAQFFASRVESKHEIINTEYPGVHKGDLLYDFIESIIKDTEPQVSKKDIFDCMSVCFAIEKSAHASKAQKVNYLM